MKFDQIKGLYKIYGLSTYIYIYIQSNCFMFFFSCFPPRTLILILSSEQQ